MLSAIKQQFVEFLNHLGYQVADNGIYREEFPYLMVRTTGFDFVESSDTRISAITLTLDIFSTYNGEKEIINISEDILEHLQEMRKNNKDITMVSQSGMKIIGDRETGPVRKHGIISYNFIVTSGLKEAKDETADSAGD